MKRLMIAVITGLTVSCVHSQEDCEPWYATTRTNEKGEQVPLPPEKIVWRRINARPPDYRMSGLRFFTTFGQMAKQCDGVFVGRVTKVRVKGDVPCLPEFEITETKSNFFVREVDLSFSVETNLLGRLANGDATFSVTWKEGPAGALTNGMRMMVFYARGYSLDIWNHQLNSFDWVRPEKNPQAKPTILMDSSGLRVLDDPEAERFYIQAAGEYLQVLRHEKRDADKYYAMLRRQIKSPVRRIRQDAWEDMTKLFQHGPDSFNLDIALNDPEIDDVLKDHIRYISIPARERRKTEREKTEQPEPQ